jgi:hypothetical protein
MRLGVGLGLVLAAVAQLGCVVVVEEPIPEAPSYELDMKPLFHARCVRCHGGGGTLNGDPKNAAFGSPGQLYIGSYDDTGVGCPPIGDPTPIPATCHQGAHRWVVGINERVHSKLLSIRMPIPPSEPLTDWEKELVARWAANPLP